MGRREGELGTALPQDTRELAAERRAFVALCGQQQQRASQLQVTSSRSSSSSRQWAPADPNPDPNPNPNQAAGTQLQAAQLQLKDQLSDALRRRAATARTAQRLCASLAPRVQRRALMRCSWHALRMHVQLARSQRPAQ
eukprot:scaffold14405_cov57-Phaeocystis_antarctica.AAC.1